MLPIDEVDGIILKELLQNGRTTFRVIAEHANTSQDIIRQHYKKMKKEGIIVGSAIQLDCSASGFATVGRLHVSVLSDSQEYVAGIIGKINKVSSVSQENIGPKLRAVVILKNLRELEEITHTIKQIPCVLGVTTEIWIGIRNILDNLSVLPSKFQNNDINVIKKTSKNQFQNSKIKLDQMDKKIIEKLKGNGRVPFRKIAQELGASTDTISRRVKKLFENKIIKPIIQINPSKLGYAAKIHLNLAFASSEKLSTIIDCLSQIPDITLIIKTSGVYDLFVKGYIKNIEHLFSIQNEIKKIPGISEIKIQIFEIDSKIPRNSEYISTF
ncbi:MAG: Lrp/AsnC family transcriptional regulator [Candidatus Bathyarchaeota archaeon]|nr:Lrp/AsnC family transcriptional regulator [Candidatus Bathyarchaeum tardum]